MLTSIEIELQDAQQQAGRVPVEGRRLRRFEHEAEILGRLQHPGIGQVYDAGTFNAGYGAQPYFAMELVRGTTHRGRRLETGSRSERRIAE